MKRFAIAAALGFFTLLANAQTVFTVRSDESDNDNRREYERKALELALEKTVSDFGPYSLVTTDERLNEKRSLSAVEEDSYPNFFIKSSISNEIVSAYGFVPFPLDRGMVGYRVAFTSEAVKEKLASVESLDQLKGFSILQGIGWLDTEILRPQGFTVIEGSSYEGMFQMVARGRGDLFMRGTSELLDEWNAHQNVPGLAYDESVALYYPLPRFFLTNKKNTDAIRRVETGLKRAYEDGSFIELWKQHNLESINFVNLKDRKIFRIENPLIDKVDTAYEQYIFDPSKE
ncbi:hypothetical protein [Pelagicoccus sp. SDUM812003]|uniref:hypothetical protein n=1 Tax=Pelagicoccus sp. SDUM812003 TaxID=3041267 RepID=UPI00280D6849|nr:hypothetical protein [Pelagicoccus sp. SDUM812003]MDQ8203305.1 hypothetical protein [Pelagicoccus sp. SDUM812003]